MTVQECRDAFFELLRHNVAAAQSRVPDGFANLGRQAANAGLGLIDVVQLCEEVQARLGREQPDLTLDQFAKGAANSMSETLAGYYSVVREATAIPPDPLHDIARQYTATAMSHQIGVWDWDLQTNDLIIDPSLKEMLGYQDHEIANRLEAWSELVHPDDRDRTRMQSQASLGSDDRSFEFEQRLLHKKGQAFWFVCRGRTIRDENGVAVRLLGTNTNVTAARLVAQEIREGVDRYRALIETVPYGIQEVSLEWVVLYCNSACDRMLGYQRGERIGRSVLDLLPTPEEVDVFCQYFQVSIDEQLPPQPLITQHQTANGRIFDVQIDWDYKRDANRDIVGIISVTTDITERRRYEETLRTARDELERRVVERTAELEAIFDNTQFLIAYLDAEFNFLTANRAWSDASVAGTCPRFATGQNFFDVYPDDELRTVFQSVIASSEPHSEWAKPFINSLDAEQGTAYWNWTLAPVKGRTGNVVGLVMTLLDVTHRVLADETIRKSEERLQAAQEMAHLGNWDWNLETSHIDWSDEMFRIFEVDVERFNGSFLRFLEVVHPDDRKVVSDTFANAMENNGRYSIDYRVVLDSGVEKFLHGQAQVTFDESGKAASISGTTQDVTERKQAEEELRQSESMQRALLEAIPDMIFRVGQDGTLLDFIPAADTRPYLPPSDFLGKKMEDVLPHDVGRLCAESHLRAAETGEVQVIEYRLDVDGTPHDYEARSLVGAKDDILSIVRDVSAERQAEERSRRHRDELAHVTRLSTMGEMATGIAHELNQPISGIASYAAACLMMLESAPGTPHAEKISEIVGKIEAQALRAGEIVRRMRKLVVRRASMYHAVDLLDAIREVLALVDSDVAQTGVEIRIAVSDNVPCVLADRIQIEQVILNLVRNAIEVMDAARIPEPVLEISVSVPTDEMVNVEVADNGPGIASADVGRIFEQFYSTKNNGMGMGLSISRTIIEAHGGCLYMGNTAASGTMFRFTLPVIERMSM